MQADRQPHVREARAGARHRVRNPHGRNQESPRMKIENAWVDEGANGPVQGRFIVEGFTHAHEYEISYATSFDGNQGTGLDHLIQISATLRLRTSSICPVAQK